MTSADARKDLVKLARAQIGTREEGGNNRGPSVRRYQAATWLQPGPWPWCAAFICWLIRAWLQSWEVRTALGLSDDRAEDWRPQTAAAFDFERWAAKRGCQVLVESALVRAGDLVVFDFSHIGIVIADAPAGSKTIKTIEGNTNGFGTRDSSGGDGVWEKTRARSLAKCFIRLTS